MLGGRPDLAGYQRSLLVHLHRQDAYSGGAIWQVELELGRFEMALVTQLATVQQPAEKV